MTVLLLPPLTARVLLGIAEPARADAGPNSVAPATGLPAVIEPTSSTWHPAPDAFALRWPALLLTTFLPALRWRRIRRVTALALILILSLFAFEAALHSAHHLTDLSQPAQCVVASVSGHVAGTAVATVALENPLGLAPDALARATQAGPAVRSLRLNQARAPPFIPA